MGRWGAGRHRFTWDGRDAAGKAVAAGVYIYQVKIDGQVEAKKDDEAAVRGHCVELFDLNEDKTAWVSR